jgi:hypothetical protein
MRVLSLVAALGEGDATSWVEALATIMTRARVLDDADATEAVECITHAAAEPTLPYDTRKRLYEAAHARGLAAIARLFLTVSPPTQLPRQLAKQLGPERPLRPTDRPLTLGERKALARTHRRQDILLLVRDPHPSVVAILLDNPHVTEAEVLKIAAARPAVPESLAKVAAHPRWSVRQSVKRALVLNPATPLADAIRVATTLSSGELTELSRDHTINEVLRKHAADLLLEALKRPRA